MVKRAEGIAAFVFGFRAGNCLVGQRVIVDFVVRVRELTFVAVVAVFDACCRDGLAPAAGDRPVRKISLVIEKRSSELAHGVRVPASALARALDVLARH